MHNAIKQAYRWNESGDAWGDAMGAWFSIAAVLTIETEDVPATWQYRPGASVFREEDLRADDDMAGYLLNEYREGVFSADDLRHAGNVLNRYTTMLRNAGRDY